MRLALIGLSAGLATIQGCAANLSPEPAGTAAAVTDQSVIDTHRHASLAGGNDDAAARDRLLAAMDEAGISRTVLHINEPSDLDDWWAAAPDRFLAGPVFPCWRGEDGEWFGCSWQDNAFPDLDWLRGEIDAGRITSFGEMTFVYAGIAPGDPRMEPYWTLAEQHGLPVFVHIGRGPPAGRPSRPDGCCPDFDPDLGNPELYRPILRRHPGLKLVLEHAGFPPMPQFGNIAYTEETFALLRDYPQVMVDLSVVNSVVPEPVHAAILHQFIERGFIDRILLGTDFAPQSAVIARYRALDYLSDTELRAILHDNAARLFGVD